MRDAEEIRQRASSAATAQRVWEGVGLEKRLAVMNDFGAALAERRDELLSALLADRLSMALAEHFAGWILRQCDQELVRTHASGLVRWREVGDGGELMLHRPDGVVLVVPPGNSPTINGASIFSVLLAGNSVIARAPANDRGLRLMFDDALGTILGKHSLPREVVTVVTGKSRDVMDPLWSCPEIATVVFFGNGEAGRSVEELAARHGKKVVLELEGSDYLLVWEDADVDAAVQSALHGFDFSSQPCPVPKHFLVHEKVCADFTDKLVAAARALKTIEADPRSGVLAPVARMPAFEVALSELADVAEIVCGGYRTNLHGERDEAGPYVAPTLALLDDAACRGRSLKIFAEEIAFPMLPIVRVRGDRDTALARMTELVRASPFALRCSIWSRTPSIIGELARSIPDVGLLVCNDEHAQAPRHLSPWGGPRRSGGPYGENHHFWQKTTRRQGFVLTQAADADAVLDALGCATMVDRLRAPHELRAPGVRAHIEDEIAWLVLDRPTRHNAIDGALKDGLAQVVSQLEAHVHALRCVILRGEGRSFSSGGDLAYMESLSPTAARQFMLDATFSFRRLAALSVPVMAAVSGYCLGGGFELALHCDLVLASDDAVFGFPEVRHGLVTTAGSVPRLRAAVGSARASELLLSARRFTAAEAERMGLVYKVVDKGELLSTARAWADELRKSPRESVHAMKQLLRRGEAEADGSALREVTTFESLVRVRSVT